MTALKDILLETNITFQPDGIRIINMDKSHTILAHLYLAAQNFEFYECKKEKIIIGVNMFHLFKLINSIDNDDTLTIYIENADYVDGIVSHLALKFENGELKEYLGSFDEFNEWNATRVVEVKPIVKTPTPVVQAYTIAQTVETPSKKTLSKNQIQKLEQDMQQFESEIKLLEKKNAELSVMMQDPSVATDSNKLMEVTSQHKQNDDAISALQKQYDEVMETWLSTQE
jgi:phosphotransferase system HPr-like phosphotransfer protein